MRRKFFTTSILVFGFLICIAAVIADLNGTWTGTLTVPDGQQYPLNYNFKIQGETLTGTASSQRGSIDFTNGHVNGDSVSFAIAVNGEDAINKGKYYSDGDSISLTIYYKEMIMHSTLKRTAK
ncbi:MAG: hypothetical protein ABI325_06490 [Ginsengibacter sp.]